MRMVDKGQKVMIEMSYEEAEQLLIIVREYKTKCAQPKVANELHDYLDEYTNS